MGETESYRDFDGFIMPDGEMVPIQDTERMFSIIVKGRESRDQITEFLWGLAKECWNSSYFKAAYDYLGKILGIRVLDHVIVGESAYFSFSDVQGNALC